MEKKGKIKLKITVTILIGFVAVFAFLYILNVVQNRMVMDQIRKEMSQDIITLEENYNIAQLRQNSVRSSFDDLYQADMKLLSQMMKQEAEINNLQEYLKTENAIFQFTDIMIADKKGNILTSAQGRYKDLKDEKYDPLREVFDSDDEIAKVQILSEQKAWLSGIGTEDSNTDDLQLSNLYAYKIDEDTELVLSVYSQSQSYLIAKLETWNVLLRNEIIGEQGFVFVWSDDEGRILSFPDEAFRYQDVNKLGMDMDAIEDGRYVWTKINGEEMYVYPVHNAQKGVWIACAVSRSELIHSRKTITWIQWALFAMLAVALVYYVSLLLRQNKIKVLTDFTGSGKVYAHQSRQHKLFIITLLVTVILALIVYYLQTLFLMSTWAESSTRQTQRIEETIQTNDGTAVTFTVMYDYEKNNQIKAFDDFMSRNADLRTPAVLDEYSYILQAVDIQFWDKDGNSEARISNMGYASGLNHSESETTLSYSELVATQDEGKEVCEWMSEGRRSIWPVTDSDGEVNGNMYIHYYDANVDAALIFLSLYGSLDMVRPGKNGFVFAVDIEEKTFSYYPDHDKENKDALTYGLTEKQIKDNYCDYITIDNTLYYASTDLVDRDVIFYVVPKSVLLSQRLRFTGIAVGTAFVLFILIGILLYVSREQIEMTPPNEERRDNKDEEDSPEYKVLHLLMYYGAAIAAIFSIYTGLNASNNAESVLGYVLDGRWEPGYNVFALSASILILCRGGVIIFVVSKLVDLLGNILPVRGGTILKVIGSLGVYIAIAILIYQCMLCFGLNPTALVASAGIASVVIGIGANSLVGDILAGLFLLMEGNVQVGDVIQIGDFRGYVMELGIRMTKLFDMDTDDIKIIPNNEVRNVVHMTMRMAIVYSDFQIRYEERLYNVERILKEELKRVPNKSPHILEGPTYIGLSELGDNGVVLRVETKCHESSRKKVEREVNHIVYTIFQANDIGVPYPQVTLHQGDDAMVEREFPEDDG